MSSSIRWLLGAAAIVVVIGLLFAAQRLASGGRSPLVVYCAHDSVYAQKVLDEFEKSTGIPLSIRYDTEATKSLSLVELIVREKDAPRCDVFWDNQLVGVRDLKDRGILEPYKGPGYERIPAAYKDPDGYWTGFAARLRVYIVNTGKLKADQASVDKALSGDLSRVAIAMPLFGTTLSQYIVRWATAGPNDTKAWRADWHARHVCEVEGNAQVKDDVVHGVCDIGLTDTDDFYEAKDSGAPVGMVPIRIAGGKVICTPNTLAIIKGTHHQDEARKLVDYLLSAEAEVALANSGSRQIPLGPVDDAKLPPEVIELRKIAADACPLDHLGTAPNDCLAWLKLEYLK